MYDSEEIAHTLNLVLIPYSAMIISSSTHYIKNGNNVS